MANARYATAIYQGQADLVGRTGVQRAQDLARPAAGTFHQPAFAEGLIASARLYLPMVQKPQALNPASCRAGALSIRIRPPAAKRAAKPETPRRPSGGGLRS